MHVLSRLIAVAWIFVGIVSFGHIVWVSRGLVQREWTDWSGLFASLIASGWVALAISGGVSKLKHPNRGVTRLALAGSTSILYLIVWLLFGGSEDTGAVYGVVLWAIGGLSVLTFADIGASDTPGV